MILPMSNFIFLFPNNNLLKDYSKTTCALNVLVEAVQNEKTLNSIIRDTV